MAHPYEAHRQTKVEHSRVGKVARGYASGGAVDMQPESKGATKKARADKDAMAVLGKPARERLDRPNRAKGGKVGGHKGSTVNVIVAPSQAGGHPGLSPPAGLAGGPSPPVAPPPRPPMMAGPPPGMPPGGPPGGMPMPPRHNGGRTYAKGGAVKSGPAWEEGLRNGTPVQNVPKSNKDDTGNIGRGRVVTFWAGGGVKRRAGGRVKYPIDTGSGGGTARLKKEELAKRATNGMKP